ncbi:MAG TPA: hypothetical protein VFC84_00215 [Desulfosporosinus sp.]|nr:hypothetical protein [Desulfosporosinus sp.]
MGHWTDQTARTGMCVRSASGFRPEGSLAVSFCICLSQVRIIIGLVSLSWKGMKEERGSI